MVQLLTLAGLLGLTSLATQVTPEFHGKGSVLGALGILLLAGTLTSELCAIVGLPHLTGYILAGAVAGPHVLHLIDHRTVGDLSVVGTLALSLIALAGGAELRMDHLRQGMKSLLWSMIVQSTFVLVLSTLAFVALGRFLPFTASLGFSALFGVGLLWGVLAVSRSPSATLAILSQTRAKGSVTRFSLAFIMSSDVVVLFLLAIVLLFVRPLLDADARFSLHGIEVLVHEIVGSVALGTCSGSCSRFTSDSSDASSCSC